MKRKNNCKSHSLLRRICAGSAAVFLSLALSTPLLLPRSEPIISGASTVALSRLGSSGAEVKSIQKALKNAGIYKGGVDGIYGNETRKAVVQFQKNCGLSADGIAGKKTLLYLGITQGGSSSGSSSSQYSNADIALIARVISGESRGEPYEGQVAVGAVILNRIQSSSFPDTVSGVVYQKGAFSCINDSKDRKSGV